MWKPLKMPQKRSKSLEIARNRSNLASADVTLQLRLGFWPVKSGQCSNVLPIVSVVGPNYQFQLLPTLSSMILPSLSPGRAAAERGARSAVVAHGEPVVGACGTRAQPPAEASCGRLVRREASACAWLVVRLTCRARGASEAAPRTLR